MGGAVDKEAYLLPVFLCKMFLGHLEGFIHTLPDGHAGHYNNEFTPTVVLVQLEHSFDVGVGFTDAGLHLNGEVIAVGPALQLVRRLDLVGALDFVQLLQYLSVGEYDLLVAESREVPFFIDTNLVVAAAPLSII